MNNFKNFFAKANKLPLIINLIIALILAQIAPYNSNDISNFGLRFLYWASICSVSWFAWVIINSWLENKLKWPYFFVGALVTFLMTIPLTAYIIILTTFVFNHTLSPQFMTIFWVEVIATSLCIYVLIYVIVANLTKTDQTKDNTTPNPHFLKNTKGKLLYIKAEDHYLRIVTSHQNKLILYKLSDAIHQLNTSDIEGMPIHRSYWVTKFAIKNHVKDGRKNLLQLINEEQLPISTTYIKQLKSKAYI
ncbi:MAG: LytTR family transcriptional regulator [Rhizobiales bacterium]|nr:LytTR family transcriptional regulator [Hyphomicrobiales bacterium]